MNVSNEDDWFCNIKKFTIQLRQGHWPLLFPEKENILLAHGVPMKWSRTKTMWRYKKLDE